MPWNMNDYPTSMKNLAPLIRKKAIDIGNALHLPLDTISPLD